MHIDSLVAAHMLARRHPAPFDARAEERYYRDHVGRPRASLRLLEAIATGAGVILLLAGLVHV